MTDRIAIVGVGEPTNERKIAASIEELVHRTARETLADAGLEREAVDNVVVCASDLEDGRAISSMVTASPGGGYRKDFIKTTDTGVHALGLAAMRMATGLFGTTLVLSWAKQSETEEGQIRKVETEPIYRRHTGLGHVTGHATTATAYAADAPDAASAANAVVERNTTNAAANEAGIPEETTSREEAADSELVSSPLRSAHLPEPSDGACGVVLATEADVDAAEHDPVWIEGLGWETDGYDMTTQTPGELTALGGAAERAYDDAGITDPQANLDGVEVHEQSAFHELMAIEALGLADSGRAPAKVLEGAFEDAEVTINPSGGPFAANPLIATGLARVAAGVEQVRAGEADRVAATASAGIADQVHGVAVLGGDQT